jgi:hypothetical protein
MTAFRLIPLPVHGALELLTGLFTMAAPFLFGFGTAAAVVAVGVGAVLVGLALSSTATGDPQQHLRGTLSVAGHHAADYGVALGLLGAAAVVAAAGDAVAGFALAAIGAAQLLLNLSTRYSARG